MNTLLNKISEHFTNNLPFVVYRKPNKKKVSGFFMKNASIAYVTNFKEKGFVFAPFKSEEKAILFPLEKAFFITETLEVKQAVTNNSQFVAKNTSEEKHTIIVEKAIKAIQNTVLQKVVISREEIVSLSNLDIVEIYKKLLITYKNAFVYIWYHPKVGLWFGATPETLLFLENNSFTTMSLAGTQLFKDSKTPVWKSKELEEQQLVTYFIENQLKNIASNLQIDKTETIKAGNLLHLRTKVAGFLNKNATLENLIRALHPTPAVCGLPRDLAREFIFKNEAYSRSYYTGFLGELNVSLDKEVEKTSLFVNLRCMKIQNNNASIFVGGGITKDSVAKKEWEETVSKALTIKNIL